MVSEKYIDGTPIIATLAHSSTLTCRTYLKPLYTRLNISSKNMTLAPKIFKKKKKKLSNISHFNALETNLNLT